MISTAVSADNRPARLDFGFIYYYYARVGYAGVFLRSPVGRRAPRSGLRTQPTLNDTDYWEVYGKVGWEIVRRSQSAPTSTTRLIG